MRPPRVAIDPAEVLGYAPWAPEFTGIDTKTYRFVVPSTYDGQLVLVASWWNCPCCHVSWIYEARPQ